MSDELVRFARKFRDDAAAALVQIVRDENAPAPSRVAAAEKDSGV
jgi:hypothetical protein